MTENQQQDWRINLDEVNKRLAKAGQEFAKVCEDVADSLQAFGVAASKGLDEILREGWDNTDVPLEVITVDAEVVVEDPPALTDGGGDE